MKSEERKSALELCDSIIKRQQDLMYGTHPKRLQCDCMKSECAMWINCAEKESEGCAFHFMGLAAADKWFSQFREEEG